MMMLLVTCGLYVTSFRSISSKGGGNGKQAITDVAVKMDVTALAEAERIYYVQNGSYASVEQLLANSTMDKLRSNRDGYTYSIEPSDTGFTVFAKHEEVAGAAPSQFPTLSMNEKMELHEAN